MRRHAAWVWATFILLGVAMVTPLLRRVQALALVADYEAVHVVAHVVLYGTLATLARWRGLTAARAALVAMGVALLQEGVQLLWAGRGPDLPELFDLCVDAIAVSAALLGARALEPRPATAPVSR